MKSDECKKCNMLVKDPLFWDTHQTMPDNSIWCVTYKRKA